MPELTPNTTPLFVIVHDTGTPAQHMEIFSQYPNRLIYSDNFVFDANGNFLYQQGFSDGDIGKQIVYSMYRLHFGHFGGWWTKIIYFLLGLGLTIISVSGINIWLAKRKYKDAINNLWIGFVWGTPTALAIPALTQLITAYTSNSLFWLSLILTSSYAILKNQEERCRKHLKTLFAILLLTILVIYFLKYGDNALRGIPLMINTLLFIIALFFLFSNLIMRFMKLTKV